ncbi:hypothetical protein DPMN_104386 [Dreissena polymorpha]|uniref:Uncharacterized protein n=1 Tax=Dreissena polymorpha TaxID=45954 RepID=A0A9D4K1L4_DREPO|nr:hypothetical protein DPMN_104386 [Dreissena polymorpha]
MCIHTISFENAPYAGDEGRMAVQKYLGRLCQLHTLRCQSEEGSPKNSLLSIENVVKRCPFAEAESKYTKQQDSSCNIREVRRAARSREAENYNGRGMVCEWILKCNELHDE